MHSAMLWLLRLVTALAALSCGCLSLAPRSYVVTSGSDWTLGNVEMDLREVSHLGKFCAIRMNKFAEFGDRLNKCATLSVSVTSFTLTEGI